MMDNRPINSCIKKIEKNAKEVFSSTSEDNATNCSLNKNFTPVKIKEEEIDDEIQEYAVTTMSELLGWYGYDKVDSGCTRSLNLNHFSSSPDTKNNQIFQMNQKIVSSNQTLKSPSVNASDSILEISNTPFSYSTNNNLMSTNRPLVSSPVSLKPVSLDSTSKFPYEICSSSTCSDNMSCSWCGNITQTCELKRCSLSYNTINVMGYICNEACFTAGKKEVFKQEKTCDWCRHIRNPISYVDVKDDENQLQFCSEKCLNQYKMNIFCHETQTHLMLQGLNNVSFHDAEKNGLITPELWFRNCQSPMNNLTEDTYSADLHLTHSLLPSLHNNKITKEEQNDTKKSVKPNRKISEKDNSICTKKCIKINKYNERRKTSYTENNKDNINEHNEEQTVINEKISLYQDAVETNCNVNSSEENELNCKDFKEYNMINIINHNSPNHQNNKTFLENYISIKNIKDLQEKDPNSSKNMLQSSSWIANSTTSKIYHEIPLLPESPTNESTLSKDQKPANMFSRNSPFKQSNQTESFYSLPTSFLPPVTVLVPYPVPIPVPIPIPIPIPISTATSNKLEVDGEDCINIKNSNCNNVECEDSIKSKCYVFDRSQISTTHTIPVTEDIQQATSDISSSFTSSNEKNNDNSNQLQQNMKSLRKRKHLHKISSHKHEEIQLKKRNKFIAT